jgi:hypothetical protein
MKKEVKQDIKQMFKKWLIEVKGLPEFSKAGNRSTACDYPYRVGKVCKLEKISIEKLVANIDTILPQYETSGKKSNRGKEGHSSVISALRYFREFSGKKPAKAKAPKVSQNKPKTSKA